MTSRELIESLAELRAARVKGDKAAGEKAMKKLEEKVGSVKALRDFLTELEGKSKAPGGADGMVYWVKDECERPTVHSLRLTLGMMAEEPQFGIVKEWVKQASEAPDTTDAGEELRGLVLADFDRQVFEEIAAKTTRVGIEYLARRLPGQRGALNADPRTVRLSVNRLRDLGLVEDVGGRKGIALTLKGKTYAALDAERDTTAD